MGDADRVGGHPGDASPGEAHRPDAPASDRPRAGPGELLDALFESAPVGLATVDVDARFIDVNDALAEINGLPRDAHPGKRIRDLLPAFGAELEDLVREVIRTGKPKRDIETVGQTHRESPTERTWLSSYVPLRDGDGRIIGAGATVIDVTAQRLAERERASASGRLALTARASESMAGTLEPGRILEALTALLVPALADHVFVDIRQEGGRLQRAAIRHAPGIAVDPALQRPVGDLSAYPIDHPMRRALETGETTIIPDVGLSPDDVPAGRDEQLVQAIGATSVIVLPMTVGGHVIGTVAMLCSASARRYGPEDVTLAQDVVARGAVALANALSYEQQRSAAVALQRSLLPESLPAVEGAEVAWRYVPGTDGTEVGGDWVDVVELPGGRIAVVVGDVMGRGLRAAAVMGQLRTAVRTLALQDPPPAELMTHLDAIVTGLPSGQLVTCVYAVYDPGRGTMTIANAGHLPPIVLDAHRARLVDDALGVPLGVGGVEFGECELPLGPGETLVLYTDGLVERPGADLDLSIESLAQRLWHAEGTLEERCDSALVTGGGDEYDDDVALLLVRATDSAVDRVVSARLPPRPQSVAAARDVVSAELAGWQVPADAATTVRLLVSELATNAVRYAVGDIEVLARRGESALFVEVVDDDRRLPRLRHAASDDEGGRGLALVHALSSAWGTRATSDGKAVWFRLDLPEA